MSSRNLKFQDRTITGRDIGFRIISDGSVTIETDDGAQLRLRPIVLNVVRTDEKNPEGERVYMVECINQVLTVQPGKDEQQ